MTRAILAAAIAACLTGAARRAALGSRGGGAYMSAAAPERLRRVRRCPTIRPLERGVHATTRSGFAGLGPGAGAGGLFATFVALAVAVARRGGRGRGALLLVSVLFLFLAGGGGPDGTSANTRWTAALLLSGMGALVMTGRLRQTGALVPR